MNQLQSFVDRMCRHPVLSQSEVGWNSLWLIWLWPGVEPFPSLHGWKALEKWEEKGWKGKAPHKLLTTLSDIAFVFLAFLCTWQFCRILSWEEHTSQQSPSPTNPLTRSPFGNDEISSSGLIRSLWRGRCRYSQPSVLSSMGLWRTLPKWPQIKPPSRENMYFSVTLAMVQVPEPLQERVPDDWQVFLPTGSSYGGGWGQLQSRPQQCCHCNW